MKHLEKIIEELNAPKTYDGETYESEFDFKVDDDRIYDANECYHIDYLGDCNSLMYDVCQEFGFPFEPKTIDEIHEKLEKAVKEDFGENTYLDWEDNMTMIICKE